VRATIYIALAITAASVALVAVSCAPPVRRGNQPAVHDEKPDSEKSADELRTEVRDLKARIKVKESLIEQKEIEKLQAYARALGIGLLALAVVLVFVGIFTPVKWRAAIGVVACVGVAMLCFFFAREIAPRMGLGGFLIALAVLAAFGIAVVYYVAKNWKKLKAEWTEVREGFAVTSRVADKLGNKLQEVGSAEPREKIEAFLEELKKTENLTREQLKQLRDTLARA